MGDRPILFNDAMIRAILSGSKTQTRRPVKATPRHPSHAAIGDCEWMMGPFRRSDGTFIEPAVWSFGSKGVGAHDPSNFFVDHNVMCPYGVPGDRLWVRECWNKEGGATSYRADGDWIADYNATKPDRTIRWRPSIHMPRWASRLTLRVTGVRVERLQDISERDATADLGASPITRDCKVTKFARLWDDIYGGWNLNPWVWVVSFEVCDG